MIQVASYCRVSTDRSDQANSFESQQRYYQEYIKSHPDWELYGIYADQGITGTSTKNRNQFNRMISDAYEGKFRIIITKEVSRFSRNILDTILYTRELKAIGVGVIFANDRINTMDPESEMLLSFLASLAQEESRRTSSRVLWGQTRQMERGIVFGHGLLGYDVRNGILTVNPVGAEIVRLIFHKYAVERVGTTDIARQLSQMGYCTYSGSNKWTAGAIAKILNNEKYVGDLVQKKTYTPDFLSHEKRINKGQVPLVVIHDHHEPIVSRDVWNMAQERLREKKRHKDTGCGSSDRYALSGKIKCGECGCSFVGRFKYLSDGTKIRRWRCSTATLNGVSGCDVGKLVRDDDAKQMIRTAIRHLGFDVATVVGYIADIALDAIEQKGDAELKTPQRIDSEIYRIRQKKENVMDSYFSHEISKDEMQAMKGKYDSQIEFLCKQKAEAELLRKKNGECRALRTGLELELLEILDGEIENDMLCRLLSEELTVFKDGHIELKLKFLPHVFRFHEP